MTDRELLERAAKAARYVITGWNDTQGELVAVLEDGTYWQPLLKNRITDCMGDALRLAVRLGIETMSHTHGGAAKPVGGSWIIQNEDDPCAATRRAIVRAAAADVLTR
jgi:hypothetical protein